MRDIGAGRIGVDTAVFIYLIEEEPRFFPLVESLFQAADTGVRELVTSALTLLEVLVVPFRIGNTALARRYEQLLTRSREVRVIDLSRAQLRDAALIRAATGIKTPDALQLAAAIGADCTTFVTNDRRLPSVAGIKVLQLSNYL